jgi:chromosomal replication initiation ATPase DnaA
VSVGAVRTIEGSYPSRPPRALVRHRASVIRQAIEPAVTAVFEVHIEDLRSPTRGSPTTAFARQVAMYLAHVVCGRSLTEIGILFARDRTTVAHACGVMEDRRDDPELDWQLEHLEQAVASLIDALSIRKGRR